MKKFQARQGDVFLESIEKVPAGCAEVKPDNGRIILAYGEATGHAHALPAGVGKLYRPRGASFVSYLRLTKASKLSHDEHGPIPLAKGIYAVTRQREYSPEEIRAVAD